MANVEKQISKGPENKNETPKEKEARENREKQEAIKETEKFQKLCVEYHDRGSSDWNMNSYEKDAALYKRFLEIKFEKLPKDLLSVYRHRLAYVHAIAQLGKNEKIRAFATKFMGISADDLGGKFELLYAKVKGSNEFKALKSSDFKDATKALEGSMDYLSNIPSGGDWKVKAAEILKPDNVDDDVAAPRLKSAFALILRNIKRLAEAKERQQ